MMDHYYQELQGFFDWEDLYREAVRRAPEGGSLVEVGVWRGKSLAFLLVEAANSGKRLWIAGIDHFRGNVGEPDLLLEAAAQDIEIECRRNLDRAGYHYLLVRKPSVLAADGCRDGAYNFVFLDASHDYNSVAADIRAWRPKIRRGGWMAGHDRNADGVKRAVAELLPGARQEGNCWVWESAPIRTVKRKEVRYA